MQRSNPTSILLVATLSALLAACGDDGEDSNDTASSTTTEGDTKASGTSGSGTTAGTAGNTGSGTATTTGTATATTTTGGETGDTDTGGGMGGEKAMIRVVHGSPDAPGVDIYVKGVKDPVIQDLKYGEASDYLEVDAGKYVFQIRAAGAPATDDPAFETGSLDLTAGAKVTALAAGLLASTDADDKFRVLPLIESWKAPGAGKAAVRVIHASPDAPTVDVDVGNDGTPEVPEFARFDDTGADGVALPAGDALQIGIWAGGNAVTAFTTPELPEGAEIFVIATGLLADLPRESTGFGLLAVGPDGVIGLIKQNPSVHALHASSNAPAVDIFAGPAELADDVSFGDLSAPIQVPPGSYTLDFFAHASGATRPGGAPAASLTTPALAAGERYLAVAGGYLGDTPAFQLIAAADGFEKDADSARVRVVHASADAPAVDVGVVSGGFTPLAPFTNLAFAASSAAAGAEIAAGDYTLGVAATSTTTTAAEFDVSLANGTRAFAVAAGDLSDASPGSQSFRLVVVNATAWPWVASEVAPN